MTTVTVEKIIASFTNNKIETSDEEPTFNLIKKKKTTNHKCHFCRIRIRRRSTCLDLMLSATKFNTITETDFTTHTNPGPIPTLPQFQTQPQIAQINATHKN